MHDTTEIDFASELSNLIEFESDLDNFLKHEFDFNILFGNNTETINDSVDNNNNADYIPDLNNQNNSTNSVSNTLPNNNVDAKQNNNVGCETLNNKPSNNYRSNNPLDTMILDALLEVINNSANKHCQNNNNSCAVLQNNSAHSIPSNEYSNSTSPESCQTNSNGFLQRNHLNTEHNNNFMDTNNADYVSDLNYQNNHTNSVPNSLHINTISAEHNNFDCQSFNNCQTTNAPAKTLHLDVSCRVLHNFNSEHNHCQNNDNSCAVPQHIPGQSIPSNESYNITNFRLQMHSDSPNINFENFSIPPQNCPTASNVLLQANNPNTDHYNSLVANDSNNYNSYILQNLNNCHTSSGATFNAPSCQNSYQTNNTTNNSYPITQHYNGEPEIIFEQQNILVPELQVLSNSQNSDVNVPSNNSQSFNEFYQNNNYSCAILQNNPAHSIPSNESVNLTNPVLDTHSDSSNNNFNNFSTPPQNYEPSNDPLFQISPLNTGHNDNSNSYSLQHFKNCQASSGAALNVPCQNNYQTNNNTALQINLESNSGYSNEIYSAGNYQNNSNPVTQNYYGPPNELILEQQDTLAAALQPISNYHNNDVYDFRFVVQPPKFFQCSYDSKIELKFKTKNPRQQQQAAVQLSLLTTNKDKEANLKECYILCTLCESRNIYSSQGITNLSKYTLCTMNEKQKIESDPLWLKLSADGNPTKLPIFYVKKPANDKKKEWQCIKNKYDKINALKLSKEETYENPYFKRKCDEDYVSQKKSDQVYIACIAYRKNENKLERITDPIYSEPMFNYGAISNIPKKRRKIY